MASNLRRGESEDPVEEFTLVRQESTEDGSWLWKRSGLYRRSFDKISVGLVGIVLVFGCALVAASSFSFLPSVVRGDPLVITITLMTSVFTLLSVRESKRDREVSVAPTLFVGKHGEKYGIQNLGNGPAHELTVWTSETQSGGWEKIEPRDRIVPVDNFLLLDKKEAPEYVRMEYRSNVGKKYNVTRKVLSNDD